MQMMIQPELNPQDRVTAMTELPPYPGTPRWVKVFGIILIAVIVLFLIVLLTHGVHRGHG
jgi:hypothetical protein